jgi:uncharacterized Zn ribbon protein
MTIKLENFTSTIDVQSIEITNVNDNIQNKTANVDYLYLKAKFTTPR